ncbi:dehydratase [Intrasporangium oryzae NRRL B-24470]|uniref:Dehydratase n=1 Tax=Intrasporangium oryzae NRRL B-24470 TaxID=1386089 RepID=W9G9Y8_9MICO|nr:MaoC/PaaZ C-terminal domain-containing protein [Intrasporangium oryzae]EWT01643.1 dehydratase [Intrasporangium oryzae NRRL B-24470]
MTTTLSFDTAPDLRRIYATGALRRGSDSETLPDVRAVRDGIRVDLDALAAYVRVCRFPLSSTLPLTYPHLLAFPLQMAVMSHEGFPLPLLGAVHVTNAITLLRPLLVTDELALTVWAQDLRPHRRGRQVDLVSEARIEGELVWRGVSTYLSRGAGHPEAQVSDPPGLEPLADVPAGPVWRLAEGTGRSYAAVSGDWNPIHVHALAARPFGFPTAIAHGMYHYARALAALGPRLPEAGLTSRVWFRKPVRLPSTVRLRSAFEPSRTLSRLENLTGEVEHAVIENTW